MSIRRLLAGAVLLCLLCGAAMGLEGVGPTTRGGALEAVGEAIYRSGVLGSGAPLRGMRGAGGQGLEGAAAACVKCHRNSGLGMQEGGYQIPPVSAPYLFHAANARSGDEGLPYVPGQRLDHPGYTEQTLARALRDGIDSAGTPLGYLMPRFGLNDTDMAALIAYLRSLAPGHAPGVTPTVLHFATIITPDADPLRRQGVIDVLEAYFAEKNSFPFGPSPQMHASGKAGASKTMYMANRHWQLHVWQLEGPAATWSAQLERRLEEQPVMAVISGLGGTDWAPVHAFCERAHLPCLFPNAEVPVVANQDFYSLYFSKGVLLEAQLFARRIGAEAGNAAGVPVLQVYRAGDSGQAAARAFSAALRESGRNTAQIEIAAAAPAAAVRQAVQQAGGAAALVLWLRPGDIEALAGLAVPSQPLYLSGLMGGLEHAPLARDWRQHAWLAYPFDLPERRVVRIDYPLGWFRIRHIPVVAEQVQVDTYLACGLLSETLNHMSDNFSREYLVERMEDMLSHRILTGYYPRLSLAEGQRFASKGGFLVRLPPTAGGALITDGDWQVP